MKALNRRRFLHSLGAGVALPFLEHLAPSLAYAGTKRRIVYIYLPNGAFWQPTGLGRNFELPPVLSALGPLKDYITVVSGLDLPAAHHSRAGDHARAGGAYLTGVSPQFPGPGVERSIDLRIADAIGAGTRFGSLYLGGESGAGSDNGYSPSYQDHFSWASPESPNSKETNPQAIFERLFGAGVNMPGMPPSQRVAQGKSVLDFALEEAHALQQELGASDRQKLDQYLASVRDLEQRLYTGGGQCSAGTPPRSDAPYQERISLLYSLMAQALSCDLTRVASFMLATEASNISYSFAGISGGHHEISHDASESGRSKIAGIAKWHVAQLANFLQKLKDTRDGDGSLLDSTLVLFGGGLADGANHTHTNLPILVAGKAGSLVPGGRHISAPGVPLSNLHLTLAKATGLSLNSIGDSTGALSLG